ncbi:MAG: YfcE family phosphodiesterase [Firmicutes bacterium]|nr:YfcE family phosphodiesterase [Bacillota bacterium]
MKYMIISDIHGGILELEKALDIYVKEHCSKLLILGDLFDYGFSITRDDIVSKLNSMKDSIVAVSGNCDINIRDILFDMPYINNTNLNDKNIILTHGHLYNKDYLSNLDADIVFMGHSHIASIEKINNKLFINPGSVSKSRMGDNSLAIVDGDKITIRNLDNEILEYYIQ